MYPSVLIIIIPVIIAFKRGHNGVIVFFILLLSAVAGIAISTIPKNIIPFAIVFYGTWISCLMYCLLEKGGSGDQLQVNKSIPEYEIDEDETIDDDDYVALITFTESSQQLQLMNMINKLNDAGIPCKSNSGVIASIMVRECDFDRAALVIGLT